MRYSDPSSSSRIMAFTESTPRDGRFLIPLTLSTLSRSALPIRREEFGGGFDDSLLLEYLSGFLRSWHFGDGRLPLPTLIVLRFFLSYA